MVVKFAYRYRGRAPICLFSEAEKEGLRKTFELGGGDSNADDIEKKFL